VTISYVLTKRCDRFFIKWTNCVIEELNEDGKQCFPFALCIVTCFLVLPRGQMVQRERYGGVRGIFLRGGPVLGVRRSPYRSAKTPYRGNTNVFVTS
jgi:hypothetical protein